MPSRMAALIFRRKDSNPSMAARVTPYRLNPGMNIPFVPGFFMQLQFRFGVADVLVLLERQGVIGKWLRLVEVAWFLYAFTCHL